MAPKVLVLGSTGYVGQNTIQALSAKGISVLAGVRDPSSDKAKPLGDLPNVELVKADMSDPSTFEAVLKQGVTAVFVITPGTLERTEITNKTIDALAKLKAPFALVVSVPLVTLPETIFGKQCGAIEAHLAKSGLPHATVRLPFFIDNAWAHAESVKKDGKFYGPLPPTTKLTRAALSDIGAACSEILANPDKHKDKLYTVAGVPFSESELAQAFSDATGKKVEYVQVDYAQAKQAFMGLGLPEWQTDGVMEIFKAAEAGDSASVGTFDGYKQITGNEPTTIKQWVEANKAGFA
eukprot:m.226493 g.226493  ORF g.226493 m.226493 type:complete len:294 (-) comp10844_c0_seq1:121-1002(-)